MSVVESFLSAEEEAQVVDAIRKAEKQTSGEIRVHLENYKGEDITSRCKQIFHLLKMDTTEAHNGVIVYVAVNLKQFYIYGDKGIHTKVGDSFWQSTRDIILEDFKQGDFAKGLSKGVLQIGNVLETYFPWHAKDANELSDEISKI